MLYKEVLENIKRNKQNLKEGRYNGIPYPYPKLNEYIASIDKGQAIGVLGATGVAKSKFVRFTFLYSVYKFFKTTGYKTRILFFCMEDSKVQTMNFVICHYLKEIHNITITSKELNSRGRELPDFVLAALEDAHNYFEEFEQIVTFIDGETEPEKVYKICENVALELGKVKTWEEEIGGKVVKQSSYTSDTHVVAIFDNMSNLDSSDQTSNEQQTILKFVKEYMRLRLCNFFKFSCVIVMQLDFESERQSFGKDGTTNVAKLEPSLASIGDSKRASRSLHLIFSLFSPQRYDIVNYPTPKKGDTEGNYYRIDILGNRFRSLRVIKANETDVGMRIGLLFDGVGEVFTELPSPTDKVGLAKVYAQFDDKQKFTKSSNVIVFDDAVEEPPF